MYVCISTVCYINSFCFGFVCILKFQNERILKLRNEAYGILRALKHHERHLSGWPLYPSGSSKYRPETWSVEVLGKRNGKSSQDVTKTVMNGLHPRHLFQRHPFM